MNYGRMCWSLGIVLLECLGQATPVASGLLELAKFARGILPNISNTPVEWRFSSSS